MEEVQVTFLAAGPCLELATTSSEASYSSIKVTKTRAPLWRSNKHLKHIEYSSTHCWVSYSMEAFQAILQDLHSIPYVLTAEGRRPVQDWCRPASSCIEMHKGSGRRHPGHVEIREYNECRPRVHASVAVRRDSGFAPEERRIPSKDA